MRQRGHFSGADGASWNQAIELAVTILDKTVAIEQTEKPAALWY